MYGRLEIFQASHAVVRFRNIASLDMFQDLVVGHLLSLPRFRVCEAELEYREPPEPWVLAVVAPHRRVAVINVVAVDNVAHPRDLAAI